MKKYIEILALIIAISAVTTLTYFLTSSLDRCIIPFEPNPYIRIPEIIMGIFSIIILTKIIGNRINKP